jgi:hypothetical protein
MSSLPDEFPTMKSLFQLDYCACSDCQTVHSVSAYVVDTLHYLNERLVTDKDLGSGTPNKTAKQALFARRPDLGDMDLSCDNTNITLPYIDVVCELLEEAVSPDQGVEYDYSVDSGLVSAPFLTFLRGAGLPFTANAVVSLANTLPPHNRVVRDKRVVAKMLPKGTDKWQIIVLKQMYGPAELVDAMPQYVNVNAYDLLADKAYVFMLPFSLAEQECKAYFSQFNVSRADLMRALQTAATGPTDSDIAAEVLGLTKKEYGLISTAQPSMQDTFWSIGDGKPATDLMTNVENFLDKTKLQYSDLNCSSPCPG